MPGLQTVSEGTAARLADLPPKTRERVIRRLTANAPEELSPPASVLELQAEASTAPVPEPSLTEAIAEVMRQAEIMALPIPVGEER